MRKTAVTRFAKWALPLAILCAGVSASGFRQRMVIDLSSPEKAYETLVDVLRQGDTDALPGIATQTGISSLVGMYQHAEFKGGLSSLGEELDNAETIWEPITDDIYVAKATEDGRIHKMEFTREEPGWMLYHWQLGGGVK